MTTFLDRIVSKALAGPDDRTAMRPRIDPIIAIPNGTINASMDGDIGEDARPGSEPEPVNGQTTRSELTGSLVTPEIHAPTVLPRAQHTGRENPAGDSRDAEPRTGSVHPLELPRAHSGIPTAIRLEERPRLPGPELPTVHMLREPVFLPTRRHVMRESRGSVAPRPPVPTSLGGRNAALESDGRAIFRDVPKETDKAEDRGTDYLPSGERLERSRIVPRVALDRGALHDVVVPVAIPSRRVLAHSGRTRDANHDETTVHVTIGRLEIRAPQSVPAAAPRRTQTTREGNLEDYLKKRASKGPR